MIDLTVAFLSMLQRVGLLLRDTPDLQLTE
jgi:hypothetical protein